MKLTGEVPYPTTLILTLPDAGVRRLHGHDGAHGGAGARVGTRGTLPYNRNPNPT